MKHLFFDMDGTVTESRQKISPEIKEILENLNVNIIIISGAERERMETQLDGLNCTIMAQSGSETDLWKSKLISLEVVEIHKHIKKIGKWAKPFNKKIKLIQNRGCQITFSFIGHEAPIEAKNSFDPNKKYRFSALQEHPFESKTLETRIAGTTCIDYTRKNGTKGKNIDRYIKEKNWKKKDCIFYGDNLQKGGNDETVIGVIKCIEVKNPKELAQKLLNKKKENNKNKCYYST